MRIPRPAAALTAATLCLLAASAAAQTASPPATIDAARQAYYIGQYGRALDAFERLARERGDAEAAESAAFMLMQGPSLYGPQVQRDVDRAGRWLLQAARAGRPGAQFMLNMLPQAD